MNRIFAIFQILFLFLICLSCDYFGHKTPVKHINQDVEEDIFIEKKILKRGDTALFNLYNSKDFNPMEKRIVLSDMKFVPFEVELNDIHNKYYLSSINNNLGVFFESNDSMEYVIFVTYLNKMAIDNLVIKHRLFDNKSSARKTSLYYSTFSFQQGVNSDDASIVAITINTLNVSESQQDKIFPETIKTDNFTISNSGTFIRQG